MNNHNNPVFIVGTPRSGTTLLRLLINSHPEIAITPESSFLMRVPSLWKKLYREFDSQHIVQAFIDDLRTLPQVKDWLPPNCSAETLKYNKETPNSLSDVLSAVFRCYAQSKGKIRWGDKTPKNLHAVHEIFQLFPTAKILIMVRDCRDVAMSLKKVNFSRISYISAAKRWQNDANITKTVLKHYDDRVYLLKYEDLLKNPEVSIRSILDFCALSSDFDILKEYAQHEDDVKHTKSTLYLAPINKENLFKWKKSMSVQDVRECEAIAGDGLEYFGYEIMHKDACVSNVKEISQRLKDVIKLTVNGKNMENYFVYFRLVIKLFLKRFS